MKTLLHSLLTFILTILISQAGTPIHLELSPTTCLPGDLVELTATSSTTNFQEFALSIPKNKNLQLIATETSPVTLHKDHYSQTTLYIFQAIAPGEHTLANITATLSPTSKTSPPIELNPLTLTVGTYDALDQDLTPAPFPTTTKKPTPNHYLWILLIIPAFICTYIIRTNTLKSTPQQAPTPSTLDTLKQELAKGQIPELLCIELLDQDLPTQTKDLIQKALYKPDFTAPDLLNSLTKEDHHS